MIPLSNHHFDTLLQQKHLHRSKHIANIKKQLASYCKILGASFPLIYIIVNQLNVAEKKEKTLHCREIEIPAYSNPQIMYPEQHVSMIKRQNIL